MCKHLLLSTYLATSIQHTNVVVLLAQWDFYILSIKFSLVFPSLVYLLATESMVKRSRASDQSLRVEKRAEIRLFFFHSNLQNCSIFQPFCQLVRIYSYQF